MHQMFGYPDLDAGLNTSQIGGDIAFGQVNNADPADHADPADPADPADLTILVRDIKVRVIQFDLGEIE